jgi:hypothetical protein
MAALDTKKRLQGQCQFGEKRLSVKAEEAAREALSLPERQGRNSLPDPLE